MGDEHAVDVEFRESVSEHAGRVMPFPVVVCERAHGCCQDIRADGLIEDDGEPSVVLYSQFPRTAAVDPAVVGRRIRGPSEPTGDREVRRGYGDRGSRDPVSEIGRASCRERV